jgi:hypothetical protein
MMLRAYPYIAAIALLLGLTVWVYMRGYNACVSRGVNNIVRQMEAKDAVRNRPHDVDTTVRRLSRGTF